MSDPLTDRLPPQDRDTERAVLGAIIRDPDILADVLAVVRAESFYFDAHRKIFRALYELSNENQPIDPVLLFEKLRKSKQLDDVGGKDYLFELWEAVPTGANAVYHARMVQEKALLRSLIHGSNETIRDAYSPTGPAIELLAQAERCLFALSADAGGGAEPCSSSTLVPEALDYIDRLASGDEPPGLSTGFTDLDFLLGGMKPEQMIVVAARPSVGKTALATAMATASTRAGIPTLFVSLEMSRRVLSMRSGVPLRAIQKGSLDQEQAGRVTEAGRAFAAEPFRLEEHTPMTAARLASTVRREIRRHGIRLVVVDYLGLMEPEDPTAPRVHQVGRLSRQMKALAKTCSVPVVVLCQLNRESENRPAGKPRLSDLRDSGEVEQDADVVLLLSRQKNQLNESNIWLIDVEVAKSRNGMTGEATLAYCRSVVRFQNAAA